MTGSSCWSCSTPVSESLGNCSENYETSLEIMECVHQNQNQTAQCGSCVCTLMCYWAPTSDLCRTCMEKPKFSTFFINDNHCPQGWTWAAETSKCYKAFSDQTPWPHAAAFCKAGNGSLAQPKHNSTLVSIIESMNIQPYAIGEFWIGSRFSENGYIWEDGSLLYFENWAPEHPLSGAHTSYF